MKTKKVLAILILAFSLFTNAFAYLPPGWHHIDIGDVSMPGSASWDENANTWTIKGDGDGIHPGTAASLSEPSQPGIDSFHYVFTQLEGDGQIIARVDSGAIMIREELTASSKMITMELNHYSTSGGLSSPSVVPTYGTVAMFKWRHWIFLSNPFGASIQDFDFGTKREDLGRSNTEKHWIRIVRQGDKFSGYFSWTGEPDSWIQIGTTKTISMNTNVYIGMAVSSYNQDALRTATFDDVDPFGITEAGMGGPDNDWTVSGSNMFSISDVNIGIGTKNPSEKLTVRGNILLEDPNGYSVMELGQGLDYAEGFDVSSSGCIMPGTVLIIDTDNPGKLTISSKAYDKKVAGIVAGAKGLGSGVRLGADQFDYPVALAGRVYCNVDATETAVEPGDLLTTSARPGYAVKATDYVRAQGAILGKAMEKMEKGKKGQILVLVTLQ